MFKNIYIKSFIFKTFLYNIKYIILINLLLIINIVLYIIPINLFLKGRNFIIKF